KDFLWGFATAAAQIEGGSEEQDKASGKGYSIWDKFSEQPGKIRDGSSSYRTCNHYELYKQDIAMMASLGVSAYRFSISWPRLIPCGERGGAINEKGVQFYSDVIDECLKYGITPFATLYHWDLPQALQDKYNGWADRRIIDDYLYYADLCFSRFGSRVQHWLTFNEPWCICVLGHGIGQFAPGITSDTIPWIVGHNIILSHAHVVELYRSKYKVEQGGMIGITLNGDWAESYDSSPENVAATQAKMDVAVGWFADPIYLGDYPPFMKSMLGKRLPSFTQKELKLVRGSSDFYGMNTYTTNTIKAGADDEFNGNAHLCFDTPNGSVIGAESALGWLRDVPWGLRKLLNYLFDRYKTPIYMTECGYAVKGEHHLTKDKALHDIERVTYYDGYLSSLKAAVVEDGVDVRSFFGWSFMDNFEWNSGLVPRFGSVHVDYETFQRTPKDSAMFFSEWFKSNVASA
ncbi:beta-glucosidase, partial [Naematelia encephala]